MRPRLAAAALLALSGCSAVTTGQLFCRTSQAVVAIVDPTGKPVSVIGQTAQAVNAICAAVNAIPVSPPAASGLTLGPSSVVSGVTFGPVSVPVVSVDTAAVRAQLMRR